MERGSYIAASAGFAQLRRLEVVNNNLANISTVGFKRQMLVGEQQTFDQTLASQLAPNDPFAAGDHERNPGVTQLKTVTDFTPGPINNTGSPLDVALREPNDFFVIETPEGPRYTRAGNFSLNVDGELVTMDGYRVLGDGGAISVTGPGARITESGSVRSTTADAGQLQVVRIQNPENLIRVGGTRFALPNGAPAPEAVEPQVVPQALEMANVSAVSSVIELMTTTRGFEAYTKVAQTIEQMNGSAVNQVGRRL